MIRRAFLNLFFLISLPVLAQLKSPEIPSTMEFAGLELKIENDAKKLMEAYVSSLTKSAKYLQVKVERANIYFPVIEKILQEEGVPDDFKYLVLQESSLIPDAVSTSNAVGYWQFKKEAASDVDLRISNDVDERMHIISSTRGAARYLKKNNIYLSNWINALLSYNLGLGGVKLLVDPSDVNAKSMKIKGTTHVYILKCLSHKIAFENALRHTPPIYTLLEYKNCSNKQLKEIAAELDIPEEDLVKYNLWLKSRKIPNDPRYSVVVPVSQNNYARLSSLLGKGDEALVASTSTDRSNNVSKTTTHKGLQAIVAGDAETVASLSKKGKITVNKFLRFNEITRSEKIIPGQVYYLEAKKNRADEEFHTAKEGETYWSIAQNYGIKKSRLLKNNRITRNESFQKGRVIWLAKTRPISVPVEITVTDDSKANKEVKVIAYQDKPTPLISKAEKTDETEYEVFPDEFYEETSSQKDAPITQIVAEPQSLYPSSSSAASEQTHTVEKGDTFYGISKKYGTSVEQIRKWNGFSDNHTLSVGQQLVIKTAEVRNNSEENAKKETYITYTVKAGDTFYKIARDHNVTIAQLQHWNNKKDSNISIGEALKIYQN